MSELVDSAAEQTHVLARPETTVAPERTILVPVALAATGQPLPSWRAYRGAPVAEEDQYVEQVDAAIDDVFSGWPLPPRSTVRDFGDLVVCRALKPRFAAM